MSNNEVEYEIVLLGLCIAHALSVAIVELRRDSRLVASQIKGEYEAKDERMARYLVLVRKLFAQFVRCEVSQVLRYENKKVDALENLASSAPYPFHVELNIMDNLPSQEKVVYSAKA